MEWGEKGLGDLRSAVSVGSETRAEQRWVTRAEAVHVESLGCDDRERMNSSRAAARDGRQALTR